MRRDLGADHRLLSTFPTPTRSSILLSLPPIALPDPRPGSRVTSVGLMATQALAANGAKVYIVGRRKEVLDRVVEVYSPNVEGQIIACV